MWIIKEIATLIILVAFVAAALIWVDVTQKEYHNKYGLYDSLKRRR